MADVSHRRSDLTSHPDAPEMRARYDRVLGGKDVALVDGPIFLVGLYCALSPWIVHFSANQADLATHNLVVGIAIALLALGLTMAPERMYGLGWAMCALGVWMVVSPWIVGSNPDAGVIWNNIIIGALTFCLGMACAATAARVKKSG